MEFDIALFALVTFGLLLNAGTLDEVRDAWALQGTRLAVFVGAVGMIFIGARLSTIDGRLGYLAPALLLGGYGVFWTSMQISHSRHVVQLSRQPDPASARNGNTSLLPLRLAISAMVGASAVLLACGVLYEPAEPAGDARSAASDERSAPPRGLEAQPVLNGAPVVGEDFVVPTWERSPVREAQAGLDSATTTRQSDEAHDQE